jgi:hypothetical protein
METWATSSIIDHRAPVYRQALALFDRIVVPVPPEPIGNQTQEELTQLEAEVSYLAAHKAAELHEWRSDLFEEWSRPVLAEAIADDFNSDAYTGTRMMHAETFTSVDVQASAGNRSRLWRSREGGRRQEHEGDARLLSSKEYWTEEPGRGGSGEMA